MWIACTTRTDTTKKTSVWNANGHPATKFAALCDMKYVTAIGLPPGGNSTVNIYKQYIEQHNSLIRMSADRAPSLRGILRCGQKTVLLDAYFETHETISYHQTLILLDLF
jgi:hypothetical protein